MHGPLRSTFALILGVVGLVACETTPNLNDAVRVKYSEEVGNIFVSAYPAVAWGDISEKLEPKNNLSTTDARTLAAVTTQAQVNQFLSTFAAGLGIGLPTTSSARTTTVAADGTTTTIGTNKRDPGTVPASSGAGTTTIGDTALAPDLAKGPLAFGLDGAAQLTAGTALYQLGQILDNQISKALPLKGYEAYLVTFQVNLQPLARNRPYDAYINLTLMPASWQKAVTLSEEVAKSADQLSPIIVFPLVISESMELSSVGRSIEVMRQAALSLSGVVSNVGINGSIGGSSDDLNSLLGSDRNSLVTVGRVSDHTLRIRLGAQQQGSRLLALVPQTRNVSVVVFTRAGDTELSHLDKLAVITETTFVDVATGAVLESNRSDISGRLSLTEQVTKAMTTLDFEFDASCTNAGYTPLDLLRSLDRGDYKRPTECVKNRVAPTESGGTSPVLLQSMLDKIFAEAIKLLAPPPSSPPSFDPALEARLRRLVARLMTIQTDSRFSKLTISLRSYRDPSPALPGKQIVLVADDKSTTKLTLRGGLNLQRDDLEALMTLPPGGDDASKLLPVTVEVDSTGKVVTLTFPSLSENKILSSTLIGEDGRLKPDGFEVSLKYVGRRALRPCSIQVRDAKAEVIAACLAKDLVDCKGAVRNASSDAAVRCNSLASSCENAKAQFQSTCESANYTAHYKDVRFTSAKAEKPGNPVSSSAAVIVPDATGVAKLALIVGDWDEKKNGKLILQVSGADVRVVEPAAPVDAKSRGIAISPLSTLTLTLANLTSAQVVQLRTIANKEPVGSGILLPVEYLLSTSR